MKNALFSGISGGAKKDSDSDEEEQKAAPVEQEINLLDFDAGATAPSTTGDLLGTSDVQAPATTTPSSGGLLDDMFDTKPPVQSDNVLGSFGISTQQP